MSCVVSIYCTIHRVDRISFSRQKRWICPGLTCPFVVFFTHRQIASFFLKLFTAQYKTAIQRVFEAVTRCKMHCQKNPWKNPHWGNILKIIHFFLPLCIQRPPLSPFPEAPAHSRPFPSRNTFSPRCSYKFLRTQKQTVPVTWQIYKQRKRLDFSFIVTKTQKKNTRKQLEINHVLFLNRKAPYWNIFQS